MCCDKNKLTGYSLGNFSSGCENFLDLKFYKIFNNVVSDGEMMIDGMVVKWWLMEWSDGEMMIDGHVYTIFKYIRIFLLN